MIRFPLVAGLVIALAGCVPILPAGAAPPVTPELTAQAGVDDASLQRGRAIFITSCTGCHRAPWIARHSLAQWRNLLPPMSNRAHLNPDEQHDLAAYVLSIRATTNPQ
jgi:mono/diheme cytochrome c family protein